MSRVFLCAILLLAVAPTTSGQNCALFDKKAKKCVKAGCAFTRVNNAKYKTCTNPPATAVLDAAATSIAAPAAVSVCPSIRGARKCRKNAGCDWMKIAGKTRKTCVAATAAPTEAPTPAPAPTPATATAPAPSWRKLVGCCRQGRQVIARKTYTHELFLGVDHKTADKMCSDACTNVVGCTAIEVEKKKAEKRKPLRFRCELHSVNVDSVSRATPSCKRAQCYIKAPTAATPRCTTGLTDANFNDAIVNCLTEDPVNGNCTSSTYGPIATWCVSDVTDFSYAFRLVDDDVDGGPEYATEFNGNITSWDTSSGTSFEAMFYEAAAFNQPIGEWDTGASTSFYGMFESTAAFNQPIGEWDTGASTSFRYMFSRAEAFNQPIGEWNTSASTDFMGMFNYATVFNQPIGEWNTGASTSFKMMFNQAKAFNQPIGEWNTGASTTFQSMFYGVEAFNQPIEEWDTGAATSFDYMFTFAAAFNQPIGEWNTSASTTFEGMFSNAKAFNQPIGQWNVGASTSFEMMFYSATAFNQPIGEWDTSNGSTNGMFNGATLMLADYTCPADGPPSSCSD